MPTVYAFTPKFQAFDSLGNLADGLKVFTYEAGTNTKLSSYTDSTGNSENTNPVVLDSRGEANIWLDTTKLYKILLTLAAEADPPINNIWTVDNFGFPQTIPAATVTPASLNTTALNMVAANVPLGNGYLTASVAANAITLALKTLAGTDPSATDITTVILRNAAITNGSLTAYTLTAAVSTVISSGSTLGCGNSEKVRIHIGAMANASTGIELFYWTATVIATTTIRKFDPMDLITTTAEGGAGGADSSQTAYSTTARTSQPWTYLGYIEATSSATAGQWASIDKIVNWQPGVPVPGQIVQVASSETSAMATGTNNTPFDDTPPLITEGDQYMTLAITPKAVMNRLRITFNAGVLSTSVDDDITTIHLHQDAVSEALAAVCVRLEFVTAAAPDSGTLVHDMRAATTSSTTFRIRAGNNEGDAQQRTLTFNGTASARVYGAVAASTLTIEESQG